MRKWFLLMMMFCLVGMISSVSAFPDVAKKEKSSVSEISSTQLEASLNVFQVCEVDNFVNYKVNKTYSIVYEIPSDKPSINSLDHDVAEKSRDIDLPKNKYLNTSSYNYDLKKRCYFSHLSSKYKYRFARSRK